MLVKTVCVCVCVCVFLCVCEAVFCFFNLFSIEKKKSHKFMCSGAPLPTHTLAHTHPHLHTFNGVVLVNAGVNVTSCSTASGRLQLSLNPRVT